MAVDFGNLGVQSGIGLQGGIKIPNMPTKPAKVNSAIQGDVSGTQEPTSRNSTPATTAANLPMKDIGSMSTTQGPMEGNSSSISQPWDVDFDTMIKRKNEDLKKKFPAGTEFNTTTPFPLDKLTLPELPASGSGNTLDPNLLNQPSSFGVGGVSGIQNTGMMPSVTDKPTPKKLSDYTEEEFNQLPKEDQANLSIQDKTLSLVNQIKQQYPEETKGVDNQTIFQDFYKQQPDQVKKFLEPDAKKAGVRVESNKDGEMYLHYDKSYGQELISDIPQPIKELGNHLYDAAKAEGGVIKDVYNGNMSPQSAALQTVSNAFDVAMAPISAGISSLIKLVPTDDGPSGVHDFLQNTAVGQQASTLIQGYQDFSKAHPEAAGDVAAIVNIGLNALGMGAEGKVADSAAGDLLKTAGEGLDNTATKIVKAVKPNTSSFEKEATDIALDQIKNPEDVLNSKEGKNIWEAIQPKLTTKEMAGRNSLETGKLGKTEFLPTNPEVKQIKTAKEIGINPKKSANVNKKIAQDAWDAEQKTLKETVAKSGFEMNPKLQNELESKLYEIKVPTLLKGTDGETAFNNVKEKYIELLTENKGDMLKTNSDFNRAVEKELGDIYNTDRGSAYKNAVKAVKDTSRDFLNEKVGDDIVKESLFKQRDIGEIIDNLNTKLEKQGTNVIKRFADKNPNTVKGIKIGGGVLGADWLAKKTGIIP